MLQRQYGALGSPGSDSAPTSGEKRRKGARTDPLDNEADPYDEEESHPVGRCLEEVEVTESRCLVLELERRGDSERRGQVSAEFELLSRR